MATAVEPQREEELTPQQQLLLQTASMEGAIRETDPRVLRVAAQLSWLASQHHGSEYNQLKFGNKGSPVLYIPLTVQLPQHVTELRVYQQVNAQCQAWYISQTRAPSLANTNDTPLIQAGFPSNDSGFKDLQDALSLAISSPLPPLSAHLHLLTTNPINGAAKTSETHPINISAMVPPDLLLRLIDFLQEPLTSAQPTYLHIPYELTLDALTSPDYIPTPPPIPVQQQPSTEKPRVLIPPSVLQAEAMVDAPTPPPAPHRSPKLPVEPALVPLPPSPEVERNVFIDSQNVTPQPLGAQPPSYFSHNLSSTVSRGLTEAASTPLQFSSLPPIELQRPPNPEPCSPPTNGFPSPQTPKPSPRLGNLLLSSCPGKKVRLHGPVKGRGTIFRNLERDLQRIRDAGVACIVCCLDDSELHFLGVPWEEYVREAHQLGLDILRLPTPEGFAPLDPAVLNGHLDIIIKRYTLSGASVLVHCRGGVGRAGLVACCWMLKMGLCGWIRKIDQVPSQEALNAFLDGSNEGYADHSTADGQEAPPSYSDGYTHSNGTAIPNGYGANGGSFSARQYQRALERIETVDLVERIIRVVRRRRSIKAIETFEQVHFLVQFVEYLRHLESKLPGETPQ